MREVSDLQLHIYRGRGKPWGGGLEREKYDGGSSLGKDLQRVRIQEEVGRKFWKKKKWISLQRSWKGLHFAWIPATPPWWMSQPLQLAVSGSPVFKSNDELWPSALQWWKFKNQLDYMHSNDIDQLKWTMGFENITLSCSLFMVSMSTALQIIQILQVTDKCLIKKIC